MSQVSIVGAYNTQFGALVKKHRETGEIEDTKSFYALLIEAGKGAVEDAGLNFEEIEGIWIGSRPPSKFINQGHILGVESYPNQATPH